MSQSQPASAETRPQNLDNRLLVLGIVGGALLIYLGGALLSPYTYGDPAFVMDYFKTELLVTGYLWLVTTALFPADRLGFRWPQLARIRQLLPVLGFFLVTVASWLYMRLSLADGTPVDNHQSLLILRTTSVVGLTEEWLFRGLLLAALCRWLGLRLGALLALLSFGCFHLINLAVGVPPALALMQVVSTILIGSIFLLTAIATRSLLLPIVVHAFYDFAVIDMNALAQIGASNLPLLIVPLVGYGAGLVSLVMVLRLQNREVY